MAALTFATQAIYWFLLPATLIASKCILVHYITDIAKSTVFPMCCIILLWCLAVIYADLFRRHPG